MPHSRPLLLRKMQTFVQMGHTRRRLIGEAAFSLMVASLALRLLPFRVIASRLGKPFGPVEAAARLAEAALPEKGVVDDVRWAIRTAAVYMPLRALCLEQAIAGKYMLERRRITGALHLGFIPARAGAEMTAHAWLDAHGSKVTGYPLASHVTEVACFV